MKKKKKKRNKFKEGGPKVKFFFKKYPFVNRVTPNAELHYLQIQDKSILQF
jgi:hypothetical protein